ncbi:MAG: ribosomal-processing cysteine protease Prp [Lachnospiraceae bacterium]|nr:ribosomal-processing cysteine protease Prp [Lachnospiraceae bacterium]
MIEVLITRDKAMDITGFRVSGHALFAEAGNDIICSAVSMLTINTVNAIEQFLPDEPLVVDIDRNKGFIEAKLMDKPTERSELLLRTFHLGMVSIEEQYGRKYVKVLEA